MTSEEHNSQSLRERFFAPLSLRSRVIAVLLLLLLAVLLRILLALPALRDTASLLRPDSMGYWNPACALAAGDGFVSAPGSSVPEAVRPIGYPLLLAGAIKLFGNNFLWSALLGIVLSASALLPLAWAGRKLVCDRAGLLAAALWAFNLTSIAAAPLILADTLLSVLAAWQIFFVVYFLQSKKFIYFAALTLCSIAASMVKPVNLPVILIGLPVILIAAVHHWRDLVKGLIIYLVAVGTLLVPYWMRNCELSGGFDGNTANAYFHNGSAVMAKVTGESSEVWRARLLEKAQKEFAAHPEQYSTLKAQNRWKKTQFAAMIKTYPQAAVITHLPNIFNLLPDVPTMLENLHITTGERGTMAVLRQQGFLAAVNHYFNGKQYVLWGLLPLLAIYGATLLLAGIRLILYIYYWQWRWLLVFGVTVFYYIWAPGPVISPRYLLPALPMMILMILHFKNIQQPQGNDL